MSDWDRYHFRKFCLGTTILAGLAGAFAPALAQDDDEAPMESVTVTGFRASLDSATQEKRNSVSFSEAIYAEDIGKFPDTNIAESFNRIPGIHISRDIDGEGVDVSIRGLGPSFTTVLLNGAQVAVASTGAAGSQNQNRQVDLNQFPTDLFTQLKVEKTPRADMEEGGIAGVINMRQARPFDNPGTHITYNLQGNYNQRGGGWGPRGTLVMSYTDPGNKWGILFGASGNIKNFKTTGYETTGYTTPTWLSGSSWCASGETCDTNSSNNWVIPDTVPATASGLTSGTAITADYLESLNPDVTTAQISDAMMPRLASYRYTKGSRDRYNFIISGEYRPNDDMQFYLDVLAGRGFNNLDRTDADLCIRNCRAIPTNMEVDANDVVTSVDLTNVSWMLEARPFQEKQDLIGLNPGMSWQISENWHVDFMANYTRSHFFRDSPTIMLVTRPSDDVTVHYALNGKGIPTLATNVNLNDPDTWTWYAEGQTGYQNGRVNLQEEKRYTSTRGLRGNIRWGDDDFSIQFGGSYDDVFRSIVAYDNTDAWQTAVCGEGESTTCTGGDGSLVTNDDLTQYIKQTADGFVTIDYNAFKKATHYHYYASTAPATASANTGASTGLVQEMTKGFYGEVNGIYYLFDHDFRYNLGLRWIETDQTIAGPEDSTSAAKSNYAWTHNTYQAFLPSLSMVYEAVDNLNVRLSLSRTMTRPNPSTMLPSVDFSDPSAQTASIGNPELKPYFSKNFDFGLEYYTGGEGYIGAMVFEKQIKGFTTTGYVNHPFSYLENYGITYDTLTTTQQAAIQSMGGTDNLTVTVETTVNSTDLLTMKGLELTWVQPLDKLTEIWGLPDGFGFTANVTFLDQKGTDDTRASDVPPYAYNLTGYYEHGGAMVRLSYSFTAGSWDGLNGNGATHTNGTTMGIYTDDYGQMDLSASYKLSKLFGQIPTDPDVSLSAQNLTNARMRTYEAYSNAVYSYYKPGMSLIFGIRGTF